MYGQSPELHRAFLEPHRLRCAQFAGSGGLARPPELSRMDTFQPLAAFQDPPAELRAARQLLRQFPKALPPQEPFVAWEALQARQNQFFRPVLSQMLTPLHRPLRYFSHASRAPEEASGDMFCCLVQEVVWEAHSAELFR